MIYCACVERVDLTFDPGDFIATGPEEKEKNNPPIGTQSASAEIYSTYPHHFTMHRALFIYFSKPIGLD